MDHHQTTPGTSASSPSLLRKMARVAMIGLEEDTASVLTECFHQFGIATVSLSVDAAERLRTEKFDACALRLDESADRVLEIARSAPANFRMIVYGLAASTAQALRLSRYSINVILDDPIDKRAALRAVRGTHLLVVHEFRRYVRIPIVTPVSILYEGRRIEAKSAEISGGGISMQAPSLPMNAPVEVEFALPKADKVRIGGTVRWTREGVLGVRFDDADPRRQPVKEWIDRYLGIS